MGDKKQIDLMILAAGKGTRLLPYSLKLPKPLFPLFGVPLVAYVYNLFSKFQVKSLWLNKHHLPELLERGVQKLKLNATTVQFSNESDLLLDSGGGIHQMLNRANFSEDFFVANGDEVFFPAHDWDLGKIYDQHLAERRLATILVIRHAEVGKKFGGVYCDSQYSIKEFSKAKPRDPSWVGYHFIGLAIYSPRIRHYFAKSERIEVENIFYDVVTRAILANDLVKAVPVNGDWYEVGTVEDFQLAETSEIWQRHQAYLSLLQEIYGRQIHLKFPDSVRSNND